MAPCSSGPLAVNYSVSICNRKVQSCSGRSLHDRWRGCERGSSRSHVVRSSAGNGSSGGGWHLPWFGGSKPPISDEYETEFETEYETESAEATGPAAIGPSSGAGETTSGPQPDQADEAKPPTSTRSSKASTAAASSELIIGHAAAPPPSTRPPAATIFWESSAGGWVMAFALLLSVRQGRLQADADRMDARVLQARQQESRVQGAELRAKRTQYLEEERQRKEAATAKKLEEARQRAEVEAKERAAREAVYQAQAAEEAARIRERREAARKEFEVQQEVLEEELAKRTAAEVALREAEAARKEAEAAAARAEEAARLARLQEERRQREEEEKRRREEAERQRQEHLKRLREQSTVYELSLAGTAVAQPAGPDSINQAARIQVQLTMQQQQQQAAQGRGSTPGSSSTSTGGSSSSREYESVEAAVAGAPGLAADVARLVTQALAAGGGGPGLRVLQPAAAGAEVAELSGAELRHWLWLVTLKAEPAGRQAVAQVAPLAGNGRLEQSFQVYSCYSTLPYEHPSSLPSILEAVNDLVKQDQVAAAAGMMEELIDRQLECFLASSSSSSSGSFGLGGFASRPADAAMLGRWSGAPRVLVMAAVYATLLEAYGGLNPGGETSGGGLGSEGRDAGSDVSGTDEVVFEELEEVNQSSQGGSRNQSATTTTSTSSSSSSSSSRFDFSGQPPLVRLALYQLVEATAHAPKDSLLPLAESIKRLLGPGHPVAKQLVRLAVRNMSAEARQARELKKQQEQVAAATAVLRRQGSVVVGTQGLDPSGAEQRKALVPAPERMWALRNVATNLLRTGGPDQAGEALRMLQEAADLAAEHYGPQHPGRLSCLLDYISALLVVPGQESRAAAAINAALEVVLAVGDRYRQQQDLFSLVLLYESTMAELDVPEVLGRETTLMSRMQRQAADGFSVLETRQANVVVNKRRLAPGTPGTALRTLAKDCTEALGVYSSSKRRMSRLEQWNRGLPLTPLWQN